MQIKRPTYQKITDDNVEALLENAGNATKQPDPPFCGVPRQWFPRKLAKLIQWICLPFVLIDCFAQKIARFIIRPPFKKVGRCKRRGHCCHYIVFKDTKGVIGYIQRFWATQINGFYFRHKEPVTYEGKKVIVMGCRYLHQNGSCRNYRLRPTVCRKWPVIEYFGWPRILKGCGYQIKKTKQFDKLPILKE